jgi:hypothetical protein
MVLPRCASATGGLQSSLQAPPLGVWLAFSPYLLQPNGWPWNPSCGAGHRLQGSLQPHRRDSVSPSICYFAVAPYIGGWTLSRPGAPQWRFSSPCRSTWRHKSTDSSACMTSRLRLNSSVILATNSQVVRARRPRISCTKASLKMGKVVPDVCSAHRVGRSLSGSPLVVSGLVMVTDARLSVVTRHDLSHIRPSACRLSSVLFHTLVV